MREAIVRVTDIPNLDPIPMYVPLDKPGPLSWVALPSGHHAVHLTKYEDVRKVVGRPEISRRLCNEPDGPTFLPGPTQKELLLNLDMPDHARARALIARDFSQVGVETLRELAETTVNRCLDKLLASPGEHGDLFAQVLEELPSTLVCRILGIPVDDRAFFRKWSKTIQVGSKDEVTAIDASVTKSFQYLLEFVRGERPCDPQGFIRSYVTARRNLQDPLTDEEFVGVLLGILLGGDHNALSVMTKSVYTLLHARPLWDMLVENPARIPAMVEELIRVIPIGRITIFPRIATAAVESSMGVIPANTVIYANALLANRDPTVFIDPLTINPMREQKPHVQFGFGIHSCMGMWLAKMEIGIVLRALVTRAPTLRLAVQPENIRWVNGVVLRRPDELPVSWIPARAVSSAPQSAEQTVTA